MQDRYMNAGGDMPEQNEEYIVNFQDVIYSLLRKWPLLLVGMLCGMALLGAYGVFRSMRSAGTKYEGASAADQVLIARSSFSEARAEEIEGLYTQYQEYAMLQSLLQDQYAEYLHDIDRVNNSYVKTVKYLCIGKDTGPTSLFDNLTVLGEEECREIGRIIDGETDLRKATTLTRNRVTFIADNNNKIAVSSDEILPISFILAVRIIGESKSQCDQIQTVIDRKMMKLCQDYVDAGGVLEMTQFATEYTSDVASYMRETSVYLSNQLRAVTDNLFYFQQNTIDKLDDDARAYYDLLMEYGGIVNKDEAAAEENDVPAQVQNRSWRAYLSKKFLLFGALAGLFLTGLILLLLYIQSYSIQSKESTASVCGLSIMDSLCTRGERTSGLQMWLYRVFHMAEELTSGKEAAMAQDLILELQKKEASSFYILLSDTSAELRRLAESLKAGMKELYPDLAVCFGDPLNEQEQMRILSDSDAALILVGLKKTRRDKAVRQLQMCSRYQVPVIRAVTLEVV